MRKLRGPKPLSSIRWTAELPPHRSVIICDMTSWSAVFVEVPEGYAAFVEELPGANAQGRTLDEARENLQEAIELVLEANRTLAEEALAGKSVIREQLPIAG